ncbi:MAG: glycosyltransferase family 4 protein, partial [Dysgonamonadaceae bacterium]|nr:glycosyltransferase family 4 protein [Dysgonamonadaceae bacterium]
EACDILSKKEMKFECHFVGKWTDITENVFKEEVEKKNLTDKVFAHGAKYGKGKEDFFIETDIFVFPTFYHNECFPLVILEAMQYGLPIISTNEGGITDIIEDGITGYIVEKQNPAALAKRIEDLILDKDLRVHMGQAGQQKFRELYTLECFEKRLCEILNIVLKSNMKLVARNQFIIFAP